MAIDANAAFHVRALPVSVDHRGMNPAVEPGLFTFCDFEWKRLHFGKR